MKIIELNLIDFGKFHNKNIRLDEGLNLYYGKNESGKTTIFKFIEGMFYGFVKSYLRTLRITDDFEKYRPWNGHHYRGSLLFEIDHQRIRLYRDFNEKKFIIYDEDTGDDIGAGLEGYMRSNLSFPGEYFFGIDAELFSKVFVFQENSLNMGTQTKEMLQDEITRRTAKAFETLSAYSSLQYLMALKNEIGTEKAKKKPLGILVHESNELREKIDSLKNIRKDYQKSLLDLKVLMDSRNVLKDEFKLSKTQALFEERERLESALKMKNDLLEEIKNLEIEIKTSHSLNNVTVEEIDQYLYNLKDLDRIKDDYDRISQAKKEAYQEIKRFHVEFHQNKEVEIKYEQLEEYYQKEVQLYKHQKFALFFFLVFLALTVVSFLWIQSQEGTISSLILTFIMLIVLSLQRNNLNKLKNEKGIKTSEFIEDYQLPQMSTKQLLTNYTPSTIDPVMERQFEAISEQIDDYDDRIEHLILEEDKKTEELRAFLFKINKVELISEEDLLNFKENESFINDNYSKKRALLNRIDSEYDFSRLEALRGLELEELDVEKYDTVQEKMHESEVKISTIMERISILEPKIEELLSAQERLEEVQKGIKQYTNTRDAIDIAMTSINNAKNKVYENYIPRMSKMLSSLMSGIRGQEITIKLGKEFNISILNNGDYLSEEFLSSGTFDQIMIFIRLFLIDEIFEGSFPLILDDAFIRSDEDRLSKLLEYLREIAEYQQVLLFTCQQRERILLDEKNISHKFEIL